MTIFDAAAFKAATEEQWDTVAARWNAWGPLLDRWLGPATETLLDMCHVGAGARVLHVAGGSGQDALQSARRVGPQGRVVSTDISAVLTDIAAENFRAAGYDHATAQRVDGEALDLAEGDFDAVVSRVGLIFFPDQAGSMARQVALTAPGGYVGALVYAAPEDCRFFSDPVKIIRRHAALPPPQPGQPGPFSLGAPGVIEALFAAAGLEAVETRRIPAPVTLASADECLRFEQESFGALHQMLAGLDAAGKAAAWAEVRTALEAFEDDTGFTGPCTMIAAAGRKPA